jgi:two-component system nitrate/nitrite response regulator NarL
MIKVIIADDHQMFIDGLKSLLQNEKAIKVIGEATNGEEVLEVVKRCKPDIVLLDISMPVMDGIQTTRRLHSDFPNVKVLMLTMHNKLEYISNLMESGAAGYILKNTGKKELIEAIQTIVAGGNYYSSEVTETIMKSLHKSKEENKEEVHLTNRERDVLLLVAQEYSTKQIADKLFISQNTVETHRKNLMSKLKVRNVAGLVKCALQLGLI